jgi:hypothetical protein
MQKVNCICCYGNGTFIQFEYWHEAVLQYSRKQRTKTLAGFEEESLVYILRAGQ